MTTGSIQYNALLCSDEHRVMLELYEPCPGISNMDTLYRKVQAHIPTAITLLANKGVRVSKLSIVPPISYQTSIRTPGTFRVYIYNQS